MKINREESLEKNEIMDGNLNGNIMSLYELPVGKSAIVESIQAEGITRRRMLDLGLVPGTKVEALRVSPAGDPKAFRIRGTVIAFREEEGTQVIVNYRGE